MSELIDRVRALLAELAELADQLADPAVVSDPACLREIGTRHSRIAANESLLRDFLAAQSALEEAQASATSEDPQLRALAAEQEFDARGRIAAALPALQAALAPRDPLDERACLLEIRAGTGGQEAALFAGELAESYTRFVERRGLSVECLAVSPADAGGSKETILRVSGTDRGCHTADSTDSTSTSTSMSAAAVTGDNPMVVPAPGAYGLLRWEAGTHRVQRIPTTESKGRIHTSAVTVAVLPEAESVDVTIDPQELVVDTFCASGAGGQHVNRTESAVRITHTPTGIAVSCQTQRSQHQNRVVALEMLRSRLLADQRERASAASAAERAGQVGTGDRSEKIRTYNFPQDRVTDHRLARSFSQLPGILSGNLDAIVDALRADALAKSAARQ